MVNIDYNFDGDSDIEIIPPRRCGNPRRPNASNDERNNASNDERNNASNDERNNGNF